MATTIKTKEGYAVRFERRRYGTVTYTWVYLHVDDEVISLGDPWPCITPKQAELEQEIQFQLERREMQKENR